MISRLIDMNIVPTQNVSCATLNKETHYTISEYATAFIDGLSDRQKARFKKMLENNIECGMSVAENYGIDYNEFITEVKNQLKVGDK